jgi:hypothetical protein
MPPKPFRSRFIGLLRSFLGVLRRFAGLQLTSSNRRYLCSRRLLCFIRFLRNNLFEDPK